MRTTTFSAAALALVGLAGLATPHAAFAAPAAPTAEARPGLKLCRLDGVEHQAYCGQLMRPLDPQQPQGRQIAIHYAVLPALARNRQPDPVFFFAGGPGQSAIELAGPISRMLSRLGSRRDVVLVDQRGTGRSAPLSCPDDQPTLPMAEAMRPGAMTARMVSCGEALQRLPHGDLRQYTTTIAMQDVDAVRAALGAEQINVVGGSYGTRAALEYQRQFPQRVRRSVIDGVAPPDMVLPESFSPDNQAALDAVWAACEADVACRTRFPQIAATWQGLLKSLPRTMEVRHPVSGRPERLTFDRDTVLNLVRSPLYQPAVASALPFAVSEAAQGRFDALLGAGTGMVGGRAMLAAGMHFSVICAEDFPRLGQPAIKPGTDYGDSFAQRYREVCANWPRGAVPADFYRIPAARQPVLVLSGGADPVTPPRHGERTAKALGPSARHVVVPQAGHGVLGLPCMRDVVFRFINAATDAEAQQVEANCAAAIPRPPVYPGLLDAPASAPQNLQAPAKKGQS